MSPTMSQNFMSFGPQIAEKVAFIYSPTLQNLQCLWCQQHMIASTINVNVDEVWNTKSNISNGTGSLKWQCIVNCHMEALNVQDKHAVTIAYIDFSRAFDSVSHDKLFARLSYVDSCLAG